MNIINFTLQLRHQAMAAASSTDSIKGSATGSSTGKAGKKCRICSDFKTWSKTRGSTDAVGWVI